VSATIILLRPISADEQRNRLQRIQRIARSLGFVGRVEYRHELRGTGGAQFGLARRPQDDLLIVDARAFELDVDPESFSLEAIIAHERGHQLLNRHPRLRGLLERWRARGPEEMMASIVGSLLVAQVKDRDDLLLKAIGDAVMCGLDLDDAAWLVAELKDKMENLV